jgi:phosphohistidine phosphatase
MVPDVVAAQLLTFDSRRRRSWIVTGRFELPSRIVVSAEGAALHRRRTAGCTYPATVRVYLCRHAQAVAGEPDELRELTAEGVEQARALGARLAALPVPPRLVLTSPLLRARQTGAEIARETGATARVEEALAPGATAAVLIAALADEPGPVATVGHQPDCSEIALAVLGRDPGFPVAGMVELELDA